MQGLAEIRGLYGTGHGRDGKARGVTSRHGWPLVRPVRLWRLPFRRTWRCRPRREGR
ncbi:MULTISPECIES: abortive infection family protein [unclassified Leptolyngbya]|uniref:abortive infection family protein n=1 Tax=Leptolyngbya sp. 7M TaxID=2812896 RepID=UPI001B8C29D2|nr:abortive infection family protein [Leptolyngbya sp. 7M]QYU69582.1 abortive infection family protein [Leptolyngbya sp. 15MV]